MIVGQLGLLGRDDYGVKILLLHSPNQAKQTRAGTTCPAYHTLSFETGFS